MKDYLDLSSCLTHAVKHIATFHFCVMGAHACIIILITCLSMELGWPIIYFSWTVCHHNLSLDQVVFLMFILVFSQVTLYITDGIFHG